MPVIAAVERVGALPLRPSMRGPVHLNTMADADPLQLESRGRITSRPHFSGEGYIGTTPADNPDGLDCSVPLVRLIASIYRQTARTHSPYLSAPVQKTRGPRSVKSPTGTLLLAIRRRSVTARSRLTDCLRGSTSPSDSRQTRHRPRCRLGGA
jgi:hypothetical protein